MPCRRNVEECSEFAFDFLKLERYFLRGSGDMEKKIAPVVVQDADSKEVLILAYVNAIALRYSLKNGIAAFWSTSKNRLWIKGETSGSVLEMVEVRVNCEQNSLLYFVRPRNKQGACHTKNGDDFRKTCFYRSIGMVNGRSRLVRIDC